MAHGWGGGRCLTGFALSRRSVSPVQRETTSDERTLRANRLIHIVHAAPPSSISANLNGSAYTHTHTNRLERTEKVNPLPGTTESSITAAKRVFSRTSRRRVNGTKRVGRPCHQSFAFRFIYFSRSGAPFPFLWLRDEIRFDFILPNALSFCTLNTHVIRACTETADINELQN